MADITGERPLMSDQEASDFYMALNRMEGAITIMRQFVHDRIRSAVDCQLGNLREALDEELTRMETSGLPWSDKHPAPPSIEEMHSLGLLPQLIENATDNG